VRILLLHNYYQQAGGEDVVVEQEKALLQSKGHDVQLLSAHNDSIANLRARIKAAVAISYSRQSRTLVSDKLQAFRPDVVHVHNFFPLLSPSVYYVCSESRVPVVQTLHNFRLICPSTLLYRAGRPCESCVGKKFAWPAVVHRCYRGSYVGSASLAAMLSSHKAAGTWSTKVNAYIALTTFAREKLIEGGIPPDRLHVKPNFVLADPGCGTHEGGFALFVGRLSPEKGVRTLLSAWSRLQQPIKLKIVGDGPLRSDVESTAAANSMIEVLGSRSAEYVKELMKSATFLVFPSECFEAFGRVIVEAFATGLPVIAGRIGSVPELIADGRTGFLFEPGKPDELARCVMHAFKSLCTLKTMSTFAREEYREKYTGDKNYQQLMHIYDLARATAS